MRDLKVFRQRNNFFMGREGVITVRDLIKWGKRDVGRAVGIVCGPRVNSMIRRR